jgi:hypothetical protein
MLIIIEDMMNSITLTYLGIILAIIVVSFVFSWFVKKETVQAIRQTISWLLKVSIFDFVKLIIFIKPWKKYSEQIGTLVWVILVIVAGKYILFTQPKITEIPGPYIPMIGYIYYLSALFIIHFVLWLTRKVS